MDVQISVETTFGDGTKRTHRLGRVPRLHPLSAGMASGRSPPSPKENRLCQIWSMLRLEGAWAIFWTGGIFRCVSSTSKMPSKNFCIWRIFQDFRNYSNAQRKNFDGACRVGKSGRRPRESKHVVVNSTRAWQTIGMPLQTTAGNTASGFRFHRLGRMAVLTTLATHGCAATYTSVRPDVVDGTASALP